MADVPGSPSTKQYVGADTAGNVGDPGTELAQFERHVMQSIANDLARIEARMAQAEQRQAAREPMPQPAPVSAQARAAARWKLT
jgi:hypothetical protein